jgi:hypothetical protein
MPVAKRQSRPRQEPPDTRDRIDLRVTPAFRERAERIAESLGLSLSAYIRLAVSERMARDDPRKK